MGETNSCHECGDPIEDDGVDGMGMCDVCAWYWFHHDDDNHPCSWGCVADFRNYQPLTKGA